MSKQANTEITEETEQSFVDTFTSLLQQSATILVNFAVGELFAKPEVKKDGTD